MKLNLPRYFRTVRHLRPGQVFGRLWRDLYHPRLVWRPTPVLRGVTDAWRPTCRRDPSMLAADCFRFLNATGSLRTAGDWDDPDRARLWRYHLHYFDDLNARGARARGEWHRALISRWVQENPPSVGTGWEPYPTSLRIVNWGKWALTCRGRGAVGLDERALGSLATQARWLRARLETHLLGNHLWANAKALTFAGVLFAGDEPESWLRAGLGLLERERDEQILPDGGHFERSPMYHAIVLEDVLDLINLSRAAPECFSPALVAKLSATAARMLRWLSVMTHPDGRIALFNDATIGAAPSGAELADYAQRLGVSVPSGDMAELEVLPDSGYVRLQNARAVLICDVAPVGPDYLPAHAHADTLSCELSLDGRRVVVNGGTSTYEPGTERQRQRSTSAHNTVEVDGRDSSEVWGAFRVARRARPFGVRWGTENGVSWLEGAHDGYARLPGRVTHRRRWVLEADGLSIEDRLEGRCRSARATLNLHPSVAAHVSGPGGATVLLDIPGGTGVRLSFEPPQGVSLDHGAWHPEFGLSAECLVVRALVLGGSLVTRVGW
jgi:uncharacterized heparinase superfamily protein